MKRYLGVVLLMGASLLGQEAPPAPSGDVEQAPAAQEPESEYGGPAILSRGGGPSIGGGGELLRLRPFLTVNGMYDSNLAAASLDQNGQVAYQDGYGVEAMFGVTGAHQFKESVLSLDYRGSLRHYTQRSYYDGFDNSLMLAYERRLTSRTSIMLGETATRTTRAFGLPMDSYYGAGLFGYDPTWSGLLTNELFDTPTTALMSRVQLVHQRTARLSFSIGGDGFIVRRRSVALFGANGYHATGSLAYRLTRYQTIGVSYTFGHFDFQSRYGQSDMHGVALNYSARLGRRWEIGLAAGGYRVESQRLTQVPVDPFIAAILGQAYGVEKFHGVSYLPHLGARITRSFRHSTATLGYDRTVLAGNGLYTTAGMESAHAGFSWTGIGRVTLQGGAGYSKFSAITQQIGAYRSYSASGGFSTRLSRVVSMIGRIDGRNYSIHGAVLKRTYYRATLGFGFTPGEAPLAIW
ncbi:MAG: hypothetical protein ABSD27_03160 [Bryobacteraceae bacterium]